MKLPLNNFQWGTTKELEFFETYFKLRGTKRFNEDTDPILSVFPEDTGFYLEVDLDYPKKVRICSV